MYKEEKIGTETVTITIIRRTITCDSCNIVTLELEPDKNGKQETNGYATIDFSNFGYGSMYDEPFCLESIHLCDVCLDKALDFLKVNPYFE